MTYYKKKVSKNQSLWFLNKKLQNQDYFSVFLENLSQQKVFVQSAIWNASEKQDPALIRSIDAGSRQRIFNKQTFSQKLLECTYTNGKSLDYF